MKQLLFLHGALGSKDVFGEIRKSLEGKFETHAIDFSGHGVNAGQKGAFSIELFAGDIISWLDKMQIDCIDVFGYSMGGYAVLYAALRNPARVGKIFTLATKFDWTEESAAREVKMLDTGKIEEKVPEFARSLAERHGTENWKQVLEKTAAMMLALGSKNVLKAAELKQINNEVLVSVGDRDKMVTIEETVAAYRNLINGKLMVLPGTPHPLEKVDAGRISGEIINFFNPD